MIVTSPDGISIACHLSGSGSPMVLVGGAGVDHTVWDGLAPLLAERHTVYALDRRGRGGSRDRPGSTVADEIADVAAVVAASGGDAIVVGHSSGALLALRAAAREPGFVRCVVAYEPPTLPPGAVPSSGRLRELVDADDRDAAQRLFLTQIVGMPAAAVLARRDTAQWQRDLTLAHTAAYDAAILEEGLPETDIPVPVRMVLGSDSSPSMAAGVRRYAAQVGAAVRILDGQQHFAMISAPELLAAEITALADVSADRGDSIAVDALVGEYERAWNAGDATAWAACFAEDVEFIDVIGRLLHGRDTVAAEQQKLFDTTFRGSRIEARLDASRNLGDHTPCSASSRRARFRGTPVAAPFTASRR